MGMLSKHRAICCQNRCPVAGLFGISEKVIHDTTFEENLAKCFIDYLQKCFISMINQYPEENDFKIGYCMFLVEMLKSPNLALEYIMKFQHTCSLDIVQRFRIHQIKSMIAMKTGHAREVSQ